MICCFGSNRNHNNEGNIIIDINQAENIKIICNGNAISIKSKQDDEIIADLELKEDKILINRLIDSSWDFSRKKDGWLMSLSKENVYDIEMFVRLVDSDG